MVGRERLVSSLRGALQAAPGGCLGLWGMRGLGKTTLCRALCAALQADFPGRTCCLEFPSLEQAASRQGVQELTDSLLDKALHQLGMQPQPGADRLKVRPAIWGCSVTILCRSVTMAQRSSHAPGLREELRGRSAGHVRRCWSTPCSSSQPCSCWTM